MHAGDVLHGVYYLTSQAIPGFQMVPADPETPSASGKKVYREKKNGEETPIFYVNEIYTHVYLYLSSINLVLYSLVC